MAEAIRGHSETDDWDMNAGTFFLERLLKPEQIGPMKFSGNIFIPFALSVILTAGCSGPEQKTQSNSQPAVQSEPKTQTGLDDLFKVQLTQFLSSASQLAAKPPTGVSRVDVWNLFKPVKGQFELLEANWPTNFCQEGKADIQEAVKGWSYASDHIKLLGAGFAGANASPEAQLLYAQLCQYETNPFGIVFTHCTNAPRQDGDSIYLTDELHRLNPDLYGEKYNNLPQLLSIASKYFERGRQSILDASKP